MRIAFITLGFPPNSMSGLDISAERLVRSLLAAGHEVTVIAGQKRPAHHEPLPPRLQIVRLPLGPTNWIGFSLHAARALARLPEHTVTHFWDVHFAWAWRGPYVASLHHSFRQRLNTWTWGDTHLAGLTYRYAYYTGARWLAEVPSLRRALGGLAVSETTRAEFIQHYGLTADRVRLTRHGIDTATFQPDPVGAVALRARLGLPPDSPVILFVGFVTPRKGLHYLAQALPYIQPAPYLVLAGRWGSGFRSTFLKQAGPFAKRVIEAGFVADADMSALYSLASVYVSPSLLEGFGLPLAEALACETPVVAADVGATREIVGPGGILVPSRNAQALASALSQLLNDPVYRRELAEAGRAHIQAHFSPAIVTDAILNAYRHFLPNL